MKISKALPLAIFLVAASNLVRSSPVCPGECQSTITALQHEITELRHQILEFERRLSACNSRRLSATTKTGKDTERRREGFVAESMQQSRQLLQRAADPISYDGFTSWNIPAEGSADYSSRDLTDHQEEVVRLGLLLPMTGSSIGKYIAGAATLAISDINADPSLMQGRKLEYVYADSGCNSITGVKAMQKLLRADQPIHGVIGGGCSSACEAVAFLTAERGVPQVSPLSCARSMVRCAALCHIVAAEVAFSEQCKAPHRSRTAALQTYCHPVRSSALWITH